jgi:hypothetical protein
MVLSTEFVTTGGFVGDTVGTGSSGIGFGDIVGLVDGNAVGDEEVASTGCTVGGGMGDIVGILVGDAVVILTLGADETSRVGMEDVMFKAGEIDGVLSTGAVLGAGDVPGAGA